MKGILSPENAGMRHAHIMRWRLEDIAEGSIPHKGFERKHLKRCNECRAYVKWHAKPLHWEDKYLPFRYVSNSRRPFLQKERRARERRWKEELKLHQKKISKTKRRST